MEVRGLSHLFRVHHTTVPRLCYTLGENNRPIPITPFPSSRSGRAARPVRVRSSMIALLVSHHYCVLRPAFLRSVHRPSFRPVRIFFFLHSTFLVWGPVDRPLRVIRIASFSPHPYASSAFAYSFFFLRVSMYESVHDPTTQTRPLRVAPAPRSLTYPWQQQYNTGMLD